MTANTALTRNPLSDAQLLRVEDVARFYGIGSPAMRKRIRLEQDCPGWHLSGNRWVVRKSTFLRWLDQQEGLAQRGGA